MQEPADAATEKKVAKLEGVTRRLGSPFVRDDLFAAGLAEKRRRGRAGSVAPPAAHA